MRKGNARGTRLTSRSAWLRYGGSDHDNRDVKYTDAHLKGYANMAELTVDLAQYSVFYNAERRHQALG